MSPERWSQVKALLERVLARPAHEREEFLRHSCLGDSELYDEVTHLVEAHAADPNFREKHPERRRSKGSRIRESAPPSKAATGSNRVWAAAALASCTWRKICT